MLRISYHNRRIFAISHIIKKILKKTNKYDILSPYMLKMGICVRAKSG